MRKFSGVLIAAAVAAVSVVPKPAGAAEAEPACVDQYLLCINDASQEEGWLYRTLREAECGADYYACIRKKVAG